MQDKHQPLSKYTIQQFNKEHPDDAACLRAVLKNRYVDTHPRCGAIGAKWYPITDRLGFVCSDCDRHVKLFIAKL